MTLDTTLPESTISPLKRAGLVTGALATLAVSGFMLSSPAHAADDVGTPPQAPKYLQVPRHTGWVTLSSDGVTRVGVPITIRSISGIDDEVTGHRSLKLQSWDGNQWNTNATTVSDEEGRAEFRVTVKQKTEFRVQIFSKYETHELYAGESYTHTIDVEDVPAHPVSAAERIAVSQISEGWTFPVAPSAYNTIGEFRTESRPGHNGIDVIAARATPIRAAAEGVVTVSQCQASNNCDGDGSLSVSGCGWYVDIRHDNGYSTRYCHLNEAPHVSVGERVTAGQFLGYLGSTGNSSGPHLHFEVHTGSPGTSANATDPLAFYRQLGINIGA